MQVSPLALALTLAAGPLLADGPPDVPPEGLVSPAGLDGFVRADRLPVPDDPVLAHGHAIWGQSCVKCHGGNRATGAPKITSSDDWAPRIAQGVDVLFDHAINGFMGPKFTQMPPQGGTDLPDEDIFAAVAFMMWASGGAELALDYTKTKE